LRLVLDEMYSPEIAVQLRPRGHDVIHASELGVAGRPDAEVFAATAAQGFAIVTNNADDSLLLVRQAAADGLDHNGVFLTSDRSLPRSKAGIGLLVRVLADLFKRNPGEDTFRNQLRWLP
jgi:hypothetical protein